MKNLNVLIADDHLIFREGLKKILSELNYIKNIDEANNGTELLYHLGNKNYEHDIIFLDISMPVMDGFECLNKIKLLYNNSKKVIVLSTFTSESYILNMYELGADGYIFKNTDLEELKRAIETILNGEKYFCHEASKVLFKRLMNNSAKENSLASLSSREIEVLKLLCQQKSSEEISKILFLSDKTINRHRQNLLEKTKTKNSIGLVLYAINNGLHRIQL